MVEGWRADQQRRRVSSFLGAGAVLLWVGPFVPWISPAVALTYWEKSGLQGVNGGEGPFFLVYGTVALLLAVWASVGKLAAVGASAIALSGVAGFHVGSLKNTADALVTSTIDHPEIDFQASIGAGLYITMAGIGFVVVAWLYAIIWGNAFASPIPERPDRVV